MNSLLKIFIIIASLFASTFIIMSFTNILMVDQIESWLIKAKELAPLYVGCIIILLLFSDLFIAMPTLTITLFSGYFLGHAYGAIAALIGIVLAGVCGYIISRYFGTRILGYLLKDDHKREDAIRAFQKHGVAMILLSRAMPILPEAASCLAGMTRMRFRTFLLAWLASSVPYIVIATYAGSISSVDNPKPAIITAIGLTTFFWIAWYLYRQFNKKVSIY